MMIPAVSCASQNGFYVNKLNDSFGSRDSFTSESLNSSPKYLFDENKQKIAALRAAWVIKPAHAGLDEQAVKNKHRIQDEQEARANQNAAVLCMTCLLPLVLLSSINSQSCFSMDCPAKEKMA